MNMDAVTVLLIDEYPLLRRGCREVLERAGYEVIAEAASEGDGLTEFTIHHPQLVVMEITGAVGGISTIRKILAVNASARILVLSMHDSPTIAARVLQAGGRGYIAKNAYVDEFLTGARQVSNGERYLSEELALALALSPISNCADPLATLSSREYEIFQLLVEGLRTADLAKTLGLTPKSVTNSYLRIKRKLHAESLPDLVRLAVTASAIKRNVLPPSEAW